MMESLRNHGTTEILSTYLSCSEAYFRNKGYFVDIFVGNNNGHRSDAPAISPLRLHGTRTGHEVSHPLRGETEQLCVDPHQLRRVHVLAPGLPNYGRVFPEETGWFL